MGNKDNRLSPSNSAVTVRVLYIGVIIHFPCLMFTALIYLPTGSLPYPLLCSESNSTQMIS